MAPRLARLANFRLIEAQARTLVDGPQDRLLMYLAIECSNLWSSFCRTYVLYACAGLKSAGGQHWKAAVPHQRFPTREAARQYLVRQHGNYQRNPNNPLHEPLWRDLAVVRNCCVTMNTGAVHFVNLALGLPARFRSELHHARNFAAHKGKSTREKLGVVARSRGLGAADNLAQLMLAPASSSHGTVTLEWITEIENSINLMAG